MRLGILNSPGQEQCRLSPIEWCGDRFREIVTGADRHNSKRSVGPRRKNAVGSLVNAAVSTSNDNLFRASCGQLKHALFEIASS